MDTIFYAIPRSGYLLENSILQTIVCQIFRRMSTKYLPDWLRRPRISAGIIHWIVRHPPYFRRTSCELGRDTKDLTRRM